MIFFWGGAYPILPPTTTTPIKNHQKTFLVVQVWRIYLPMEQTQVWSLAWEDPELLRAAKPVEHNYRARAP